MAKEKSTFGVAIVGCGTVGCAAATILTRDSDILSAKTDTPPELRHIVDVDFTAARAAELDEKLFSDDLDKVLNDADVDAVVELVGGTTVARTIVQRALQAGKFVVTANKALLAHHGPELFSLARKNSVCISAEASCAGGIPIIGAICGGLVANRIDALYGIVNGTCNYILTAMTERGQSYGDALAQAQKDGLAEAEPSLDVGGMDSAHKLTILASLAFAQCVDLESICVEGIDSLELCDIVYGQELGYVVKLLAIAQRTEAGLSLSVRPAFISRNHPLAWVSGPFNAVSVYGHATGHTMYYGRGAGGMPTASAVVSDLAALAMGTAQKAFEQLSAWPDRSQPAKLLPIDAAQNRYYIRVMVEDQPGVLAQLADVIGSNDISIRSVLQHAPQASAPAEEAVPVVITTHTACEGHVRKALAQLDALKVMKAKSVCIAIVDEHPERL